MPRPSPTIYRHALDGRRPSKYSGAQWDTMIMAYLNGQSAEKAAAMCGAGAVTLRVEMRRRGVPLRCANDRAYYPPTVDETRFATCDTEEEVYWLGFLYTDGNITVKKGQVKLILSARDYEHVAAFGRFLGRALPPIIVPPRLSQFTGRPYQGGAMAALTACSRTLAANLVKQGMHDAKTWTVRPWDGPPELMPHFWRGAIDGDGSLCYSRADWSVSFFGNVAMVTGFADFVAVRLGRERQKLHLKAPQGKAARAAGHVFARVAFTGNQLCRDIAHLLYGNAAIALPRKRRLAERILAMPDRYSLMRASKADLIALYAEHGSWAAVGRAIRSKGSHVSRTAKRRGVTEADLSGLYHPRAGHRRVQPAPTADLLRDVYARCRSWDAVASELDIARSYLGTLVKRLLPSGP